MSPILHLYMTPGSCSLAPHIALQESGLDFQTTNLQAARGFPVEHLHLNAKARVPILDMDGELITETPAILSTISALASDKNLLGRTPLEHARAQEWLAWLCGHLHGQAFGCLFRPQRFVGSADSSLHNVVKSHGREVVKECFGFIERNLGGREWAVGEGFTVVDAYLLVFYRWGNMVGYKMGEEYPSYAGVVRRVVQREGVKKVLESEGISALNE
ncbi:glutathione S-transferase [Phaeosphaeriaceae sp. PMI808]|nr:glutathione S-transferase [Phaeosphaeriaceae sp. PMI808]